ncbi:hypothetical protein BKA57DRAFT_325527 [Linnemannia elongata]|nr:hypothetical protein BKA57DRAFT_325527 [Linnemannia elongata]
MNAFSFFPLTSNPPTKPSIKKKNKLSTILYTPIAPPFFVYVSFPPSLLVVFRFCVLVLCLTFIYSVFCVLFIFNYLTLSYYP